MAIRSLSRSRTAKTPSNRSHSFLFESEALRLQKTLDTFIIKLEHERRQDILLSEQIRILEEEIKRRKEKLGSDLTVSLEEKKLRQKIAAVAHETRLLETSIADTQTLNRSLMTQIEGFRREHTNYRAAISSLKEEIKELEEGAVTRNGEYLRGSTAGSRFRTSIEQLRSKSAHERMRQVSKLQELSTIVKDDLSAKGSFFRTLEENFKLQMKRSIETIDPIPIQQTLIRKWKDKLSDIMHTFEHYIRHIKVLEEAFRSIENVTGMSNIREIVTTIIKTEEQHYNLYMLMNTLNAEIDSLEEALVVAGSTINRLKLSKDKGEQQASEILHDLSTRVQDMHTATATRNKQLQSLRTALSNAFSFIEDLMVLFSSAAFQDIRPSATSPQKVTLATVLTSLAELEANITTLITWQSYVSSSSVKGLFNSLAINRMSSKRFGLDPITVSTEFMSTLVEDEEIGGVRMPLREEDFRFRVRKLLDQPLATPTSLKPLFDAKKPVRTPH